MKPDDFKDGDAVVCNRAGHEIGGFINTCEYEGISGVKITFRILRHRRLPCGYVGLTHCQDMRLATSFERRMMTEMDVGMYVQIEDGQAGFGHPVNQWTGISCESPT